MDTISLKESITTSQDILKSESYLPARQILIEWFSELEERLSSTQDERQIQRIDQWQKRLRALAKAIDTQNDFIEYVNRAFTGIDDAYWGVAIDGEKLQAEIADLKRQNECLLAGWRRERNYWTGKKGNPIMKVA